MPLPPNPEIVNGIPTYEVEAILSHRDKLKGTGAKGKSKGKMRREYLIKWAGYGDVHNSWEPEANIDKGLILDEYVQRLVQATTDTPPAKTLRRSSRNVIAH